MTQPPVAHLYPHACNVWRGTESINATTGKIGATTWATAYTSQACYFETGSSTYTDVGGIIAERDQLFTLDAVHFPSTVTLMPGDVLKQTSGPETGQFFRIRGDTQYRTLFSAKGKIFSERLERAPSGVS